MEKEESGPGPGRPSEYRLEFCETAARCYAHGATDIEVADELGVSVATIYRWRHAHPEFRESTKLGKEAADERVEAALYNRAVGYSFDSVKVMQYEGQPVIIPYREHIPPDPGAAFNWLKNRRSGDWKDRKELTGGDGGPVHLVLNGSDVNG